MNWRDFLPKSHPLRAAEPEQVDHSFCESVAAGSKSRWHIRPLTRRGKFLGGGADSMSLCGRKVSWDLSVGITPRQLQHACPKCVQVFNEKTGS